MSEPMSANGVGSMSHKCEACGAAVVVVSDKEGTCHYQAASLDLAAIQAYWDSLIVHGAKPGRAVQDIATLLAELERLQGEVRAKHEQIERLTYCVKAERDTLAGELEEARAEAVEAQLAWQVAHDALEQAEAKLLHVETEREAERYRALERVAEAAAAVRTQRAGQSGAATMHALCDAVDALAALRGEKVGGA